MIKASKLRKSRRLQIRRRHNRIRKKVHGTGDRPRLAVRRSLRNIEGQVIDDDASRTVVGLSTLAPELRREAPDGDEASGSEASADEASSGSGKVAAARAAGRLLAERATERGVTRVVFDRGGHRYHGRVRAFAEGAREGGLVF